MNWPKIRLLFCFFKVMICFPIEAEQENVEYASFGHLKEADALKMLKKQIKYAFTWLAVIRNLCTILHHIGLSGVLGILSEAQQPKKSHTKAMCKAKILVDTQVARNVHDIETANNKGQCYNFADAISIWHTLWHRNLFNVIIQEMTHTRSIVTLTTLITGMMFSSLQKARVVVSVS